MSAKWVRCGLVLGSLLSLCSARAQTLLNVDLDAGTATAKSGPAAIGQSSSDFWNFYTRDDGHGGWLTSGAVSNLKYANGSGTSIGLQVLNSPGAWGNGSSDPMYAGYIYPFSGNATLNLTNMPAGLYDFYIYGPDGIYQVSAGGHDFGSKATANAATVNPIVWDEGVQ